jgi:hypothetical protein
VSRASAPDTKKVDCRNAIVPIDHTARNVAPDHRAAEDGAIEPGVPN